MNDDIKIESKDGVVSITVGDLSRCATKDLILLNREIAELVKRKKKNSDSAEDRELYAIIEIQSRLIDRLTMRVVS